VTPYLDVPYVLTVETVCGPDGEWLCQLRFEELPGCMAAAPNPFDALDLLERERERCIASLLAAGKPVPVPRPPLRV
jgi:hypothetical protein